MPSLQCLECGYPNKIDDRDVILRAENPEDKEGALTLSAVLPLCEKCGEPFLGMARVLYVDREKKFAVRYPSPWKENIPFEPDEPGYVLRNADSAPRFREKVFLLDSGLDDIAVELLKIVTIKANRDIAFLFQYCVDMEKDCLSIAALCKGTDDFTYKIPMEAYVKMKRELAEVMGEGWRPDGFAKVNRGWVERNVLARMG